MKAADKEFYSRDIFVIVIAAGLAGYFFSYPQWIEHYNDEKGFLQFEFYENAWIWNKPERREDVTSLGVKPHIRPRNARLAQIILPAAILSFLLTKLEASRRPRPREESDPDQQSSAWLHILPLPPQGSQT